MSGCRANRKNGHPAAKPRLLYDAGLPSLSLRNFEPMFAIEMTGRQSRSIREITAGVSRRRRPLFPRMQAASRMGTRVAEQSEAAFLEVVEKNAAGHGTSLQARRG